MVNFYYVLKLYIQFYEIWTKKVIEEKKLQLF